MNSNCIKGNLCQFRHNEKAKTSKEVCQEWRTTRVCNTPGCESRHSAYGTTNTIGTTDKRNKGDIFCYWEKNGGCLNPGCEYKHIYPRNQNGAPIAIAEKTATTETALDKQSLSGSLGTNKIASTKLDFAQKDKVINPLSNINPKMNVTNINNLNIKSKLDVENKSAVLEPNKSVMEIFESRLKARLMSNRPKVSGSIGPITEGSMFKPSGSIASAFNNTENSTSAKKVFDATSHGNLLESTSGITNNNSNDRISAKMADRNIPNAGSAPVLHKSTVFGQYSASAKHNFIPTPKNFEKTNPTITLSGTDTSTSIGKSSIAGNNNIANTAINAQSKPGFEKADEKNKKQPMIKVKTLAEILEEKRKRKSESESCLTPEEPIVSASDKTDNDTLDKNIKDDSNSSHIRSMHTSSETGKVTSTNTTPPRKPTVNEFATPGRSPPKDSSSLPNETCGNFDMYFFPEPISTPKNTFISTKTNGNTTPTTFAHDSSYQQRDIFASPILVLKDKTLIALEDECDINRKKVRLSLDYYM